VSCLCRVLCAAAGSLHKFSIGGVSVVGDGKNEVEQVQGMAYFGVGSKVHTLRCVCNVCR
jgi:hypothetical protein